MGFPVTYKTMAAHARRTPVKDPARNVGTFAFPAGSKHVPATLAQCRSLSEGERRHAQLAVIHLMGGESLDAKREVLDMLGLLPA